MGDRANIIVKAGGEQVCLYTHWGGSELPQTLLTALSRKVRWDDFQYLTRIIFCEMLDDLEGETGFGITNRVYDDEYGPLTVDVDNQTVRFDGEGPMSFDDYINSNPEWPSRRES